MELKEFLTESLKQIIDGITEAQIYAKEKNAAINPDGLFYDPQNKNLLVNKATTNTPHVPQIIEFDVVLTVTEGDKAKASLGVFTGAFGLGTQAQLENESVMANRIKFSIPIIFPKQK